MKYLFAKSLIVNKIRLFRLFSAFSRLFPPFSLFQRIRLLDFSALMLMHWCWCTEADALILMHWSWCTDADALMLIYWCSYTDADILMLMHWYWCADADALLPIINLFRCFANEYYIWKQYLEKTFLPSTFKQFSSIKTIFWLFRTRIEPKL